IQPSRLPSPTTLAQPVAREGRYTLYRVGRPSRAAIAPTWGLLPPGRGLRDVTGGTVAVAESPGVRAPTVVGNGGKLVAFHRAGYSELSPEHVRVTETWTPSAALLIVRNAWDPNWHATVDGHPATVLIADYMMQGVRVPP